MQAYELTQLVSEREASSKLYLEFLKVPDLSMGLYVLPAGGTDPQSPHTEDEVYYVVSGRAKILVANEDRDVQAGSIVYVAKNVAHHFHSIEEDLTVLVFFAPAEYANRRRMINSAFRNRRRLVRTDTCRLKPLFPGSDIRLLYWDCCWKERRSWSWRAFMAHRGYLNLPLVISIGFFVTFACDQFFFWMGRTQGNQFLERRPSWKPNVEQAKILRAWQHNNSVYWLSLPVWISNRPAFCIRLKQI